MKLALKETDGLYTSDKNVLLTLCMLIVSLSIFMRLQHGLIGVAHAGWKGRLEKLRAKMVKALQNEGVSTEEILVVIGPSICQNCYVVDDKVMDNSAKIAGRIMTKSPII